MKKNILIKILLVLLGCLLVLTGFIVANRFRDTYTEAAVILSVIAIIGGFLIVLINVTYIWGKIPKTAKFYIKHGFYGIFGVLILCYGVFTPTQHIIQETFELFIIAVGTFASIVLGVYFIWGSLKSIADRISQDKADG